jgi:hypothetical protein
VDRSTITRAVHEVRPLLAARDFAVPGSGSASSTPTPSTSSGGPCNAGSDAASTSTRPTKPSPAWSPTARPCGNQPPANPPGQHGPTSIAHHVVSPSSRTALWLITLGNVQQAAGRFGDALAWRGTGETGAGWG